MSSTVRKTAGDALAEHAYPVWLCSFSALDVYLGLPSLPFVIAETNADITALARIFENLRFPGADMADAAAEDEDGRTWYFRCRDPDEPDDNDKKSSFPILSLMQEFQTRCFYDESGIYPQIRELRNVPGSQTAAESESAEKADAFWEALKQDADNVRLLMEGALILARYQAVPEPPPKLIKNAAAVSRNRTRPPAAFPNAEAQRMYLSGLLVSSRPDRGLEFMRKTGLLEILWPELAALDNVDHSKEFHPEGNVWKHTLETFRHRKEGNLGLKSHNLCLSLGLLLHDAGKPAAEPFGKRRFDGHAELGAAAASRFLKKLEFPASLIDDVYFLVRNHMLPAALGRLPLAKTKTLMDSPLFPVLMELYRCDEASSFKGLEGYYNSSAVYRSYLRNARNPYRSADGSLLRR